MGILRLAVVTAMVSVVPAHAGPADWPSTNKEPDGQRFSPLAEINAGNVGRLREAWVYHMKPADGSGGTRLVTTETVPLVVGDTMFVSTPYGRVVALDSATGKEKWNVTLPDNERPAVRGVALLDAALPRQAVIEPTEPGRSRWVLFAVPLTGGPPKVDADRATLDDNGYQVGVLPEVLGDEPPAEELCRWVESLGLL